ncbi:MAG: AGE family epimerase/isomerase [Arenimonas sp.]|nr:AGE family epimerase/isomerase [Arenimonas sp.]
MATGGAQRIARGGHGERTAPEWAAWFHGTLMPWWLDRARDTIHGGFFDRLTEDGVVEADDPKSTLVQARLLFTLSHLHLHKPDDRLLEGARAAYRFLTEHQRDPQDGGYVRTVDRSGRPTGLPADRIKRSYDQSFVLLALSTYQRVEPTEALAGQLNECWSFIETRLTDPETGALYEDDSFHHGGHGAGAVTHALRAQNPHMHMFEALLQAYEMTGDAMWMRRAEDMLAVVRRHFLDPDNGTIVEFRAADLGPAEGRDGSLREIGHQCEWSWLLHRYVRLGGHADALALADRMMDFAERCGFHPEGPMKGAAYDEVHSDGRVMTDTMLLWPQTEAGKAYVARFERLGHGADADRAHDFMRIVFQTYFAGRKAWRNRVDGAGRTLQAEALSRLLYHVTIFVTEGERVGLWPDRTTG